MGSIGIKKVDGSGNKLTGAGFTLYKSDGTTVVRAEEMVDAAGKVAFGKLPLGTYIIRKETTVPSGYTGMADKTVTIDKDNIGKVINITAVNTNGRGDGDGDLEVLAFTGPNTTFYIAGFLLMLIGAIGSIYLVEETEKKRREEGTTFAPVIPISSISLSKNIQKKL